MGGWPTLDPAELNGDTADSVWRALSAEHQKVFPTASSFASNAPSAGPQDAVMEGQLGPASLVEAAMDTSTIVAFGQRPGSLGRKRRARPVVPEQASLFSLS
jgi:hypothetical protein